MKERPSDSGLSDTEKESDDSQAHSFSAMHPHLERIWSRLHELFPERQIYIRSNGRVQFFTFGPSLQVTMVGLGAIFLAWIVFASVNVIFKDHIIAAKDHRYQVMQSAYEGRVADLQLSYDELNGALLAAEDRFKSKADALEAKQNSIARLVGQKRAIDSTLAGLRNSITQPKKTTPSGSDGLATDSGDFVGAYTPVPQSVNDGELPVLPAPAKPQPRTARPTHASLLDVGNALYRLVFSWLKPREAAVSEKIAKHPALRALSVQTARLIRMDSKEDKLLRAANAEISARAKGIARVMQQVGIDPAQMEQKSAEEMAIGGPLLPLSAIRLAGVRDTRFQEDLASAQAAMSQLKSLVAMLRHVPLSQPIEGNGVLITSDFGARIDPFTRRAAFHAGIDFGGPWGMKVHATAPGVVVWAGPRGAYGNMVEVDDGLGVRTRYGHLSRVLVHRGQHIIKGQTVGRLGSTGRSTGPHVHYEVWLDNTVRNPAKFLEAGHHVLE